MVNAAYADTAASWLARVLETPAVSLEHEVLAGLESLERELEIDRSIVVETDRRGPDAGDDWVKLCELVSDAATRVVTPLLARPGTLLLTQPGLFPRYRLDAPLHALREATQREVVLHIPAIDDAPDTRVPVNFRWRWSARWRATDAHAAASASAVSATRSPRGPTALALLHGRADPRCQHGPARCHFVDPRARPWA